MTPDSRLPTLDWVGGGLLLLLLLAPAAWAGTEAELAARWRGAWAVVQTEIYSDCSPRYTDNRVSGELVSSRGRHRFGPGELAKVEKVDLKRARVDLLLSLAQQLRVSRREGPFTLYDHAECRAELQVEVPRRLVREGRVEEIDLLLLGLVDRHATLEAAAASGVWNRRQPDPFPDRYEETLLQYEMWKAEQANAEVQARLDRALDQAGRLAAGMEDGADYLEGFARGLAEAGAKRLGECADLLRTSEYAFVEDPPEGHGGAWEEGFREGQLLIFYVRLADRLRSCFVPMPPPPPPAPDSS